MAKTYSWQTILDLAQTMAYGVPLNKVSALHCDMVNAAIWKAYPWADSLTEFAAGKTPLEDGVQDYTTEGAQNCYRLTRLTLVRTDVTPNTIRDLTVAKDLSQDLSKHSPMEIVSGCLQAGIGKIRLTSAVQIPTGIAWEIQGQYQPHPVKIDDLTKTTWFHDEHAAVAAEGLIYWAYRLAGDDRAGTMQMNAAGKAVFTGQLGTFMSAIKDMARQEDYGNVDSYYPSEGMVQDGRRSNISFPFMF